MGLAGKGSSYRIPRSELQRIAVVDLQEIVNEIVERRVIATKEKHKRLFFEKIEKTETCWNWKGAKSDRGYGSFRHEGKYWMRANRVSYILHKGEIPDGMLVCHSCDNPECVNPDHLHLGSPKDNMDEMAQRGRAKRQPKGENAHNAKLSDNQVAEIREMRKQKIVAKQIAAKFNISTCYVYELEAGIYR